MDIPTNTLVCHIQFKLFHSMDRISSSKWISKLFLLSTLHTNKPVTHPQIDLIKKIPNAHIPYPRMLHSEQKCAHFCSEQSILGYGTGAFWDLWNCSIGSIPPVESHCAGDLPHTITQGHTQYCSIFQSPQGHPISSLAFWGLSQQKYKTAVRLSYLYNENSYAAKIASVYW